jgi:hypothetical protein
MRITPRYIRPTLHHLSLSFMNHRSLSVFNLRFASAVVMCEPQIKILPIVETNYQQFLPCKRTTERSGVPWVHPADLGLLCASEPFPGHCSLMRDDLEKAYGAYQQAFYLLRNSKVCQLPFHMTACLIFDQDHKLYDRYGSLNLA